MSNFLPDNIASPSSGKGSTLTPAISQSVSDKDIELAARVASAFAARPQQLIAPLMSYIADAISVSNLLLPIGQIVGFSAYQMRIADAVTATESTTSTSYTDLTHAGPTLTEVPDGVYAVLFGCQASNDTSGANAFMAVAANGGTPADTDALEVSNTNANSGTGFVTVTLDGGGNNTLTAKYRASSGTASFRSRWLIAVKSTNL